MHPIAKVVIAAISCFLVIGFIGFILSDAPTVDDEGPVPGTLYMLQLDCSNAAQMHNHGLPTKADVLQWHVHGNWGYYQDGKLMLFDTLPGRDEIWDKLYEIGPNKAFRK